jgi:CRISPR/Cas system-associated exonuclease Cas4 (RecB family)
MSQYYKPHRNPDWNYGGPRFRLSRSKIALFIECPRCFYIDNKLGVARPPGFPFNLNSAVDALLKKEFDTHRAAASKHPLFDTYGIDAIPFMHKDIDVWRENFKGVEFFHEPTGFTVAGAVDDVWINPEGELIVVDYKSTSKDAKIESLDQDWHDGYKRQMEIYQWLLRQRGFTVSDTGYFVYANASKDREAFDAKLEFDVTLISYTGSTEWVEKTLFNLKDCLDDVSLPKPASDCDYCTYREAVGTVLAKYQKNKSAAPSAPTISAPSNPLTKISTRVKNHAKEDAQNGQLF